MVKLVKEGVYLIGELIEPKTFLKIVLSPDGDISTETFVVEGRKIPLVDLRKRIFEEHKRLGITLVQHILLVHFTNCILIMYRLSLVDK